jgi:hypothetical protein
MGRGTNLPRETEPATPTTQTGLDHIILGINDLDRGIEWVEKKTGVRAAFGGVHPGRGTRNALLSLGRDCYVEIIAPDPQQESPTWFSKMLTLSEPRLLTWAVHTSDLANLVGAARGAGIPVDGPHDGARTRPDGKKLSWKLSHLRDNHGGLLPFFIEWNCDTVHPAVDAPAGCAIKDFYIQSPVPQDLTRICQALGVTATIRAADRPGLRALLSSPKGDVVLTS